MKFKQLIIKNIGSIESKTIDFSGDILADAPLFLICARQRRRRMQKHLPH